MKINLESLVSQWRWVIISSLAWKTNNIRKQIKHIGAKEIAKQNRCMNDLEKQKCMKHLEKQRVQTSSSRIGVKN